MTCRRLAGRGTVLLAALLLVAASVLVATGVLVLAGAERAEASTAARRARSRAVAWSGLQAVMYELGEQRDALLEGAAPVLPSEYDVFEEEGGLRGVAELVDLGDDRRALPEAGRININAAGAESLGALGAGVAPGMAELVAAARSAALASEFDGGFAAAPCDWLLAEQGSESELGVGEGHAAGSGAGRIVDMLTALSVDPEVRAGASSPDGSDRGRERFAMSEFGEGAVSELRARWGEEVGAHAQRLASVSEKPGSPSALVASLRYLGVPARLWPIFLDAIRCGGPFAVGRVDLNSADAKVLAAVPGLTPETAGAIVANRERLERSGRRTIVWPLIEGLITEDQLEAAADHLCARSLQWRVRIEAGVQSAPRRDEAGVLRDVVRLDAVIDVSGPRARVAFLRDVTVLEAAERIAPARREPEPANDTGPEPAADEPPTSEQYGLHLDPLRLDTDLHFGKDEQEPEPAGPPERTDALPDAGPVVPRVGRWIPGRSGGG